MKKITKMRNCRNMPCTRSHAVADVIGILDLRADKAHMDYLEYKNQRKFYVKPPSGESNGDSIELMYLENLRELNAKRLLQKHHMQCNKHERQLNIQRTRSMFKIQDALRRKLIKTSVFLKDCEDKRITAERTISEQMKQAEWQDKQNDIIKESLRKQKEFLEVLTRTFHEYQHYARVLEEVVEKSQIYESVQDCMARCDALMLAQVEISSFKENMWREMDEMRKRMFEMTQEVSFIILGMQNELILMEREYEAARAKCLKWEQVLVKTKIAITKNEPDKYATIHAIVNLFYLLRLRNNRKPKRTPPFEIMLDYINNEHKILLCVIAEMTKHSAKGGAVTEQSMC